MNQRAERQQAVGRLGQGFDLRGWLFRVCCSLLAALSQLSFDHLIRPRQRNREADLLGGFEIDETLKLCRPFYG